MRLAVSNIAWPVESDEEVAAVLRANGATGVEIAPTKYWLRPLEAGSSEIVARRDWWADRGLPIVAMQALLFGRNDLTIFGDAAVRRQTRDYLFGIVDLAKQLGARVLVFGSPKNRRRGELPLSAAEEIAEEFFREVGRHAGPRGVHVCLEANPIEYGCDFIVNSAEAIRFVERVGQEGFGLHLDTGGMTLAGDLPEATLTSAGPRWKHFHVSEPHLAPIGTGGAPHAEIGRILRKASYSGWVSIEMKEIADPRHRAETLIRSMQVVRADYG